MNIFRWLPLLLLGLLTVGCSDGPSSPEAALSQRIAEAEQAAQARDLSTLMGFVDPDYRDDLQRDRSQLRVLLAAYFFRHQAIHVLSKIDRIDLPAPDEAQVVLFAGLAASAKEASGPLAGWRGDLLRFDLRFRLDAEGEWLLQGAAWRRATREDFTR